MFDIAALYILSGSCTDINIYDIFSSIFIVLKLPDS